MVYTLKELKEMSTEELIVELIISSDSMTKASTQKQEKIVKVLAERNTIDYDKMEKQLKKKHIW